VDFHPDLYEDSAEIEASGESFAVTVELGRARRSAAIGVPTLHVSRPFGPPTFVGNYTLKDAADQAAFKQAVESSAARGEPERLRLPNGREYVIEIDFGWFEGFGAWAVE